MAAQFSEKEDKPATAKPKGFGKKPLQQGVEDGVMDYYDIMVIGRTGMGKSTTVDKLLIASLPGSAVEAAEAGIAEPQGQDWQAEAGTAEQQGRDRQEEEEGPVLTPDGRKLKHSDLIMWLISDKEFESDRVSMRLKNLVFFRSVENSHKEINSSRESDMHIYESTSNCELFSNETTKIRVLDVPGFFGRDAAGEAEDLHARGQAAQNTDLSIMRKILRIKSVHSLNFRRVVYFLPDKGKLVRTSHNLIMEIGIMEKYFGRAIFDNMVVAATLPSEIYGMITDENVDMFSDRSVFERTTHHLQEAIKKIFKDSEDIPEPPLIFVSLFDTCEAVLQKVQRAKVREERIQLELSRSVCSRCGVKIFKEGKDDAEATYIPVNQSGAIAEEDSTCHPMLVPKYSKVAKFLGGIAHLVTFRRFVGKWPSFESMDEECINCRQPPSSHGCVQVGQNFPVCGKDIIVEHSNSPFEPYQIEVEEEGEEGKAIQPPADVAAGSASNSVVCSQIGDRHYVYQDGKELFKQFSASQDLGASDTTHT